MADLFDDDSKELNSWIDHEEQDGHFDNASDVNGMVSWAHKS